MMGKQRLIAFILIIITMILSCSTVLAEDPPIVDLNLTILTHPDLNMLNALTEVDIINGYAEIGKVSFLISADVPWVLRGKVTSEYYPVYSVKPPASVMEFAREVAGEELWLPLDGEIVFSGEATTGEYREVKLRYNLLEWERYSSGNYTFDVLFDLDPDISFYIPDPQ